MSYIYVLPYAVQNVTTSAYITLINEMPVTVSAIQIADSSGQLLRIAIGLAGQEIDIMTTPISGNIIVPCFILKGSRLSIKAISATASTGFNAISLLPNNAG